MAYHQISRKEAETYRPKMCKVNEKPARYGETIGYNAGIYGWNWDLVLYRGKYYVWGYRSFPKTFGRYTGGE